MIYDAFAGGAFVTRLSLDVTPKPGDVIPHEGTKLKVRDVCHYGAGRNELYVELPPGTAAQITHAESAAPAAADDRPAAPDVDSAAGNNPSAELPAVTGGKSSEPAAEPVADEAAKPHRPRGRRRG